MKIGQVFCIFLLLICTQSAYAAEETEGKKLTCEDLENLARSVMNSRQSGVSMSDMVKVAPEFKWMIIAAFEQPRFSTEENQTEASQDFANTIALACYKNTEN